MSLGRACCSMDFRESEGGCSRFANLQKQFLLHCLELVSAWRRRGRHAGGMPTCDSPRSCLDSHQCSVAVLLCLFEGSRLRHIAGSSCSSSGCCCMQLHVGSVLSACSMFDGSQSLAGLRGSRWIQAVPIRPRMKVPTPQCIMAGLGGVPVCHFPGSHVFHEAPGEQGMCGTLNSVHVYEWD